MWCGVAWRGVCSEFVNRVQRLRKKAGLLASDQVEVFYSVAPREGKDAKESALSPSLDTVVKAQEAYISSALRYVPSTHPLQLFY
jgi:hypothetical protein